MRLIAVFKLLTRILFITAASLAFTIIIAEIYKEPLKPFIYSSLIALFIAILFYMVSRGKNLEHLTKREAYFSVSFAWLFLSVLGALPYVFSGQFASLTDAFFESVSGFTTTGSSILNDIEALPKSILFWRSMTHWIGGIGIIVLVIIIMPSLKIGSYNLFSMESSLNEKIVPRTKVLGRRLLYIYIALTFLEVIFLLFGNMPLFDSVCHAFGTVATGGFSPKNTSIADYSPYIQYVITIFMLLAGVNFSIHYFIIKRDFKRIWQNEELKLYLFIIFISGAIITAILYFDTSRTLEHSFREAYFQVVSIITCTGFASADYLVWPATASILIFVLMFVGGSTGSTAGGIKVARHLMIIKNIKRVFKKSIHPQAIVPIKINSKSIKPDDNTSILTFILLYLIVFVIGTLILIFIGIDYKTSASSIATAMGGIGPGFGRVGPVSNFASLPDIAKIIISFFMILGRLEIYTVIIIFTPSFWKK